MEILSIALTEKKTDKILVYYDPDVDGLMSGYLVQRWLKRQGIQSSFYINENRAHGFKMPAELKNQLHGYLIVAVDFSMSKEELQSLVDIGADVVCIDHHEVEYPELVTVENVAQNTKGVLINNQYSFEPEEYRFLSGAGMVYYVLSYFNQCIGLSYDDTDERSMVGISLLSDVRPTENALAVSFLEVTYQNTSDFMQYLIMLTRNSTFFATSESFGAPTMNRNYVDYNFSPRFNALFRLNKGDLAVRLINGDMETARLVMGHDDLNSYRDIQNGIVESLVDKMSLKELSSLAYGGVEDYFSAMKDVPISNFIGMACSRIKNYGKTAFLYVEKEGKIHRGSVRGACDRVDYLSIFRSVGLKCDGHKVAFGVHETALEDVDFQKLNSLIQEAEMSYRVEAGKLLKVIEVVNLKMFLQSKNIECAKYNSYVRDTFRVYLRYTGVNYTTRQRGKLIEYQIDGVPVKCFDESINLDNGLLLPICGKGDYIEFTLRRVAV